MSSSTASVTRLICVPADLDSIEVPQMTEMSRTDRPAT
jgi:hypothetical protein